MKGSYLKGNIICALPQLKDIFFSRSIIYITHHNKDGAVGIVLNYKIMNIKGAKLFKKLDIQDVKNQLEMEFPFHIGGPLNQKNGFILHSNDYKSENTLRVTNKVKLTCSTEILSDIAKNKGPKKFFISLGYSGWGPGQLEDEIKSRSWFVTNVSVQTIMSTEGDDEAFWKSLISEMGAGFEHIANAPADPSMN